MVRRDLCFVLPLQPRRTEADLKGQTLKLGGDGKCFRGSGSGSGEQHIFSTIPTISSTNASQHDRLLSARTRPGRLQSILVPLLLLIPRG